MLKWNAVFKNAIWQQGNGDISWDDFTIELSTDEEIADTGVLAFFYYKTENIYFALEDHSEMSLTILDTEAHDSLGDDLNDFINIFFRTAEPSLDIEEANSIIQYLHHLEDDVAFDFLYSDNMSFEYSRFGIFLIIVRPILQMTLMKTRIIIATFPFQNFLMKNNYQSNRF